MRLKSSSVTAVIKLFCCFLYENIKYLKDGSDDCPFNAGLMGVEHDGMT